MTVMNCTLASSGKSGHEDDGVGHVLHVHPGLGQQVAGGLQDTLLHALGHLRGRVADVDLPAGDVVLPSIEGSRTRQAGYGVLGGRVRCRVRPGHMGGDRSVVDDPAALRILILHDPEGLLRAEEGTRQVDVHHGLPLLGRQLFEEHRGRPGPGVVEQQVQAAVGCLRFREEALDLRCDTHVRGHDQQPVRGIAGIGHGRLQGFFSPAREDHAVACVQKRQGTGLADAGTRAGDDGDFGGFTHAVLLSRL